MDNRYEIAEQNGMSREFADWFFDNKKAGCGNVWFVMMAAMWEGWKGSTAMLQGAELVTTAYKLRDAVEVIRNSGIAIDAEKILAERDALNSPVIPDGWVACSERLPEETKEPDGGATGYLVLYAEGKEPNGGFNVGVWNVTYLRQWWRGFITHWQPLPAAPQQEAE
ncbi:DUF551 domain-containing protein [Citrobacter sedlakii]|uniref:DUF551 domain-containing protein n=1 Tax=Citrobacter sedlakii TaxID=67826 RepID=UPI00333DF811|nr:DUF551 domain-containing protein [Citrobacter sedlakii]